MPWVAAVAGAVGAIGGSMISGDSAEDAAETQAGSAREGIAEQRRQFDALQKLLAPYVSAGTGALTGQQDLLGLNGQGAQGSAISAIEASPMFSALKAQGEGSILANASATGGLRGGNVQSALGQFSPQLLAQLIESQYGKLGGLTTLGQNSAVMTGNAGQNTGNAISQLLQQAGAAQAGGQLAAGRAQAGALNGIASGVGYYGANGGFGSGGGSGGGTNWAWTGMPEGTF